MISLTKKQLRRKADYISHPICLSNSEIKKIESKEEFSEEEFNYICQNKKKGIQLFFENGYYKQLAKNDQIIFLYFQGGKYKKYVLKKYSTSLIKKEIM